MCAEKNYSWNSTTYICENSKHLESAVDDWKIKCDQIIMWRMVCQQIFMTKMSDAKWISYNITIYNYHYLPTLCKTSSGQN